MMRKKRICFNLTLIVKAEKKKEIIQWILLPRR